jgi:hypothetical protein
VTIFLENSAAGRLWSCGTPSLAWNYLESFLQCNEKPLRTDFLKVYHEQSTCPQSHDIMPLSSSFEIPLGAWH